MDIEFVGCLQVEREEMKKFGRQRSIVSPAVVVWAARDVVSELVE